MTGVGAGLAGLPIYEAADSPGGICSSYYLHPGGNERLPVAPPGGDAYRFELGGGHWIFGGDPIVHRLIRSAAPVKSYARKSSVWFPDRELLVPYPIQNHLKHLGPELATQCLREIVEASNVRSTPQTMGDWLRASFGETLCRLFFEPFHQYYTAGLCEKISPQDAYKSPVDLKSVIDGAFGTAPAVGYNTNFIYPADGLNVLRAATGVLVPHPVRQAGRANRRNRQGTSLRRRVERSLRHPRLDTPPESDDRDGGATDFRCARSVSFGSRSQPRRSERAALPGRPLGLRPSQQIRLSPRGILQQRRRFLLAEVWKDGRRLREPLCGKRLPGEPQAEPGGGGGVQPRSCQGTAGVGLDRGSGGRLILRGLKWLTRGPGPAPAGNRKLLPPSRSTTSCRLADTPAGCFKALQIPYATALQRVRP